MVRNLNKASQEQTNNLALWAVQNSYEPMGIIAWLKSKNYQVRGTHFQATNVANVMQGIMLCEALVKEGSLKATKKNGLQWS